MNIKSNQDVNVGEIFVRHTSDECGSCSYLYKVMEKRGKTLVILRPIMAKPMIDESCDKARSVVRLLPVPEAVNMEERLRQPARAYYDEETGKTRLYPVKHRGESVHWSEILNRYEEYGAHCSGWYGRKDWEKYEKGLPLDDEADGGGH